MKSYFKCRISSFWCSGKPMLNEWMIESAKACPLLTPFCFVTPARRSVTTCTHQYTTFNIFFLWILDVGESGKVVPPINNCRRHLSETVHCYLCKRTEGWRTIQDGGNFLCLVFFSSPFSCFSRLHLYLLVLCFGYIVCIFSVQNMFDLSKARWSGRVDSFPARVVPNS